MVWLLKDGKRITASEEDAVDMVEHGGWKYETPPQEAPVEPTVIHSFVAPEAQEERKEA